jgi:hypothetical protein
LLHVLLNPRANACSCFIQLAFFIAMPCSIPEQMPTCSYFLQLAFLIAMLCSIPDQMPVLVFCNWNFLLPCFALSQSKCLLLFSPIDICVYCYDSLLNIRANA